MAPAWRSIMCGATALAERQYPERLVLITSPQSASVSSQNGLSDKIPALAIRMSIWPNSASVDLRGDVHSDDVGTVAGQCKCVSPALAAPRAGDEGDLVGVFWPGDHCPVHRCRQPLLRPPHHQVGRQVAQHPDLAFA